MHNALTSTVRTLLTYIYNYLYLNYLYHGDEYAADCQSKLFVQFNCNSAYTLIIIFFRLCVMITITVSIFRCW